MVTTGQSRRKPFEGLVKIDMKSLIEQASTTLHRGKEAKAYYNAADILPEDLAQKHGYQVNKEEAGETERPDDFTAEKNTDITGDVLDVARQKATPTLDLSSLDKYVTPEEKEQLQWIGEVIKNLDGSPNGEYASSAERIIKNILMVMGEDRARAARNPMQLIIPAAGYKSIINMDIEHRDPKTKAVILGPDGQPRRGMLASIATDQYHVTQPRKAFTAFLKEVEKAGVNSVYANMEQTTRFHDLSFIIDPEEHQEFTVTPDDGRPVHMGFHLGGGFIPGRSTTAGGWLIRSGGPDGKGGFYIPCWNIFNVSSAMGYVNLPHRMDETQVIDAMVTYIRGLPDRGELLARKINNAIKTEVDDDLVEWVMQAAGVSPARSVKIKAIYKSQAVDEQGHMYGIFNSLTQSSNNYSITRQENFFNRIEDIIDEPENMLKAAIVLREKAIEEAAAA